MPEQTRGSQWIWPKNQLRILMSFFLFMTVSVSHASEFVTCGEKNPNNNDIDLSEPAEPGPFHDLTTSELTQVMTITCVVFFFLKDSVPQGLSQICVYLHITMASGSCFPFRFSCSITLIFLCTDLHTPQKCS